MDFVIQSSEGGTLSAVSDDQFWQIDDNEEWRLEVRDHLSRLEATAELEQALREDLFVERMPSTAEVLENVVPIHKARSPRHARRRTTVLRRRHHGSKTY